MMMRCGSLLGVVENRLVGEIGNVLQACNRRHDGRRPGRDHEPARLDAVLARFDGFSIDEAPGGGDDLDAEAGEAFDRVIRRDRGDDVVHVVVHGTRIDQRIDRRDAERRRVAHRVRALASGQQRLRGHAAVVQAIAAHLVLFDQDDALAEGGGRGGDGKPARARADDAEINIERLRSVAKCREIAAHL